MSEPRAIAAAWGKAQTEAYVEPHPTGIESRGVLTILKGGTLQESPRVGRQGHQRGGHRPDRPVRGRPARPPAVLGAPRRHPPRPHRRLHRAPASRHCSTCSIWLAITSPVPVVPVILDPQNGQSLPQWRGKVPYAAGVEECVAMVRGLHAGMMRRSRRLASMTWKDDGHEVKGMSFFDPVSPACRSSCPSLTRRRSCSPAAGTRSWPPR